jgi:hypothetical protein
MLPQSVALKATSADKLWVCTKREVAVKTVLQQGRGETGSNPSVTRIRKDHIFIWSSWNGICLGKKEKATDAVYRKKSSSFTFSKKGCGGSSLSLHYSA